MKQLVQVLISVLLILDVDAQLQIGSDGRDGALNPSANLVINMADHPDGIYRYTSVHIPQSVTVTFIPNANNTPVVWLVQGNCVIKGSIDLLLGLPVGPGGFRGGNSGVSAGNGHGPGGGIAGQVGGNASHAEEGGRWINTEWSQGVTGPTYGNVFLLPLLGGSGGGGCTTGSFISGGGGGAILIAAEGEIDLSGSIKANAADVMAYGIEVGGVVVAYQGGGAGSGGSVRLVCSKLIGSGSIDARGGRLITSGFWGTSVVNSAGAGRVRFDVFENMFNGTIHGGFTQGFQPIVIPISGQVPELAISSISGVPVATAPSGRLSTPDALLSPDQLSPISVVVRCSKLPLNTLITLTVKPAIGAAVTATGRNDSGTLAASTATILINVPRGGGLIYATANNQQ